MCAGGVCWSLQSGSYLDTYLVLGAAVPDGHTVYVMRREVHLGRLRAVWFYDAVAGRRYNHDDPHCPFKQIGCAFNAVNIWANLQTYDLAHMSYDFNNSACWSPMLPKELQPLDQTDPGRVARQAALAAQLASAAASGPAAGANAASAMTAGDDEGEQLLAPVAEVVPSWWDNALTACLPAGGLTRDYVQEKLLSINGAPLLYKETSAALCAAREGQIKRAVQLSFESHRTRMPTRWEYAVSDILRDMLGMAIVFLTERFHWVPHATTLTSHVCVAPSFFVVD